MPRIDPVQVSETEGKTKQLLEGVQRGLGMVPNLMKTLAQSPAALAGYLNLNQALSGALNPALREQIAVAVAGANNCDYCASAHTLMGVNAGLDADELIANLAGDSGDDKTRTALHFALAVVDRRGLVTDEELDDVRAAGYTEAQVVEIVAVVVSNIFSNYFNHVADTEIDFPVVETPRVESN